MILQTLITAISLILIQTPVYALQPLTTNKTSTTFQARSLNFEYSSFTEAKVANSFLRFDLESSLIGFLTARFPGFAKQFSLHWEQSSDDQFVRNLRILIPVSFMDTDRESRTEEMQNDCLEIKNHKDILVLIPDTIKLVEQSLDMTAQATIRGQTIPLNILFNIKKNNDSEWQVSGTAPVKLKDINVNNPTIARGLASFNERVKISYQFNIPKN